MRFLCAVLLLFTSISCTDQPADSWSFAFMTDIHLQPESRAVEGFAKAIETVNGMDLDLVVTGGDLIMDALATDFSRADRLYKLWDSTAALFDVSVCNTIGNHEVLGWDDRSEVDTTHPEYGKAIYEKRIAPRYHSFDHKGWHFILIDSIDESEDRAYRGCVDSTQIEWIREDLTNVDATTPIVISTHIPLISAAYQYEQGSLTANPDYIAVENSREVLDLFEHHNLKLVLQGHLHYLEDLNLKNRTHFLTGGAVCAKWWQGPHNGLEEGFVVVHVQGSEFTWEYIDYGWEAEISQDD